MRVISRALAATTRCTQASRYYFTRNNKKFAALCLKTCSELDTLNASWMLRILYCLPSVFWKTDRCLISLGISHSISVSHLRGYVLDTDILYDFDIELSIHSTHRLWCYEYELLSHCITCSVNLLGLAMHI